MANGLGRNTSEIAPLADYFVGLNHDQYNKFKVLNGVLGNGSVKLENGKLPKEFIEQTLKSSDLQNAIIIAGGNEVKWNVTPTIGDYRNDPAIPLEAIDASGATLQVNVQAAHNGYRYRHC